MFLNCTKTGQPGHSVPRFANISAVSGLDFADDGRAVAVVDWDHDGDLDLWLRNRTAPRLRLMLNRANELHPDSRSVAVRLKGTSCNRDAIGARVELVVDAPTKGQRLVQSVRAGDAFLSQSSLWLHFGIGRGATVRAVIVDWPGGSRERFTGIAGSGRFQLVQGSGRATRSEARRRPSLTPRGYQTHQASAAARVVLPGKIALPTLLLQAKGEVTRDFHSQGTPTLIVFWTSSCPNCRQELSEFAAREDELRGAGLDILAVCLDDLGEADVTENEKSNDGQEFLEQIAFPFSSARTTADSIDRVRHFQNALFNKYPRFVVPLSFLTDSQGQIVCIYRGTFPLEVVLRDRELFSISEESRRTLAAPLPGLWFTKPATTSQIAELVGKRLYAHAADEGLRYYELAMNAEHDPQRQTRLRQQIITTYLFLARTADTSGDLPTANRYFEAALRVGVKSPIAHHAYAVHLARHDEMEKAEKHFRTALRLRPDYPTAKKNLERLLRRKTQ